MPWGGCPGPARACRARRTESQWRDRPGLARSCSARAHRRSSAPGAVAILPHAAHGPVPVGARYPRDRHRPFVATRPHPQWPRNVGLPGARGAGAAPRGTRPRAQDLDGPRRCGRVGALPDVAGSAGHRDRGVGVLAGLRAAPGRRPGPPGDPDGLGTLSAPSASRSRAVAASVAPGPPWPRSPCSTGWARARRWGGSVRGTTRAPWKPLAAPLAAAVVRPLRSVISWRWEASGHRSETQRASASSASRSTCTSTASASASIIASRRSANPGTPSRGRHALPASRAIRVSHARRN